MIVFEGPHNLNSPWFSFHQENIQNQLGELETIKQLYYLIFSGSNILVYIKC